MPHEKPNPTCGGSSCGMRSDTREASKDVVFSWKHYRLLRMRCGLSSSSRYSIRLLRSSGLDRGLRKSGERDAKSDEATLQEFFARFALTRWYETRLSKWPSASDSTLYHRVNTRGRWTPMQRNSAFSTIWCSMATISKFALRLSITGDTLGFQVSMRIIEDIGGATSRDGQASSRTRRAVVALAPTLPPFPLPAIDGTARSQIARHRRSRSVDRRCLVEYRWPRCPATG